MLTIVLVLLSTLGPVHGQGFRPFGWRGHTLVSSLPHLAQLVAGAASDAEVRELRAAARARGNGPRIFTYLFAHLDDPAAQDRVFELVGEEHPVFGTPEDLRRLSPRARELMHEIAEYGFTEDEVAMIRERVVHSSDAALDRLYAVELPDVRRMPFSATLLANLLVSAQVRCEQDLRADQGREAWLIRRRRMAVNASLTRAFREVRRFNPRDLIAREDVRDQMDDLADARLARLIGVKSPPPVPRLHTPEGLFDVNEFNQTHLADLRASGAPERVVTRVERWALRKQIRYLKALLRAADGGVAKARARFAETERTWNDARAVRWGLRRPWSHPFEEARFRDPKWEAQIRYEILRAEARLREI